MDGRISAINNELIKLGKRNQTSIMSYSAKFASSLYGPFRNAANSGVTDGGNRKGYQFFVF